MLAHMWEWMWKVEVMARRWVELEIMLVVMLAKLKVEKMVDTMAYR